jgi:hypothetical protein
LALVALAIVLEPCMDGARWASVDRLVLSFGRLRPCIRRLDCSLAARPDEFRGRFAPNQWYALECAPVRTGCPLRLFHLLPSSYDALTVFLGRCGPHVGSCGFGRVEFGSVFNRA